MSPLKLAAFTAAVITLLGLLAGLAYVATKGMPHGPATLAEKAGPTAVVLGVIIVAALVVSAGFGNADD